MCEKLIKHVRLDGREARTETEQKRMSFPSGERVMSICLIQHELGCDG